MTKVNKDLLSEELKKRIINYLIESPLNVDAIPDDIERELYANILNVVDEVVEDVQDFCIPNLLKKLKSKIKACFK